MRLVAALALGVLLVQVRSSGLTTVVVIDTDSPALAPDEATRLRTALLDGLDPATTRYARLSREGLAVVSAGEAPRLIGTTYLAPPPPEVTFAEAVEILRGNQAVRDDLLARRCGGRSGCGSPMAARVEATVRDTERRTARKVRSIAGVARANPGARLVVLTAGWPTRDDGRAGIGAAVRELRASGVTLVVVRVAGVVRFQGLVRDAAERLAAHLGAAFATPFDAAEIADVRRVLALDTSATSNAVMADAVPPVPAVESDAVVPPSTGTPLADRPDALLRTASAYVERFERTLSAVRWQERYEQDVRVEQVYGTSRARTSRPVAHRLIESEMMMLWLPGDRTWLTVRDVVSIDGRARAAGDRRLSAVTAGPTISVPALRDLARENGWANIGDIARTFNEPTLALLFLDARYRPRFSFSRTSERTVDGRRLVTYAFEEQARPTVVRAGARDLPAHGEVRIDAATGLVRETVLELADGVAQLHGRMTVTYGPSARFDVLVPEVMREVYRSSRGETVTTEALYSNFRRFETSGRLVPD